MKFKGSIKINKPQKQVAELFANPGNLKEYQDGFQKKELIQGNMGETGAISKMYYKYGKRDMLLMETVVSNHLPDSFEAHYHHQHMDNTMRCQFIPIDANNTRYDYEFDYTRISWIMPKVMFLLFLGMFKRQGEKWMRQFKAFVERQL